MGRLNKEEKNTRTGKDQSHFPSSTRKRSFTGGSSSKEPTFQCRGSKRCVFDPWVGKIPWRRAWRPSPVFLPGESQGQRSLVGYHPWGRKESDMTEATHTRVAHGGFNWSIHKNGKEMVFVCVFLREILGEACTP